MKLKFDVKPAGAGLCSLIANGKAMAKQPRTAKAGVLGHKRNRRGDGGFDNVDIAVTQEFGTRDGKIPPRSFVMAPFKANAKRYSQLLKALVPKMLKGLMTLDKALNLVGLQMAADMKKSIKDGLTPPNSPRTIAKKKSSKPLIDTGQLVTSITHAVVDTKSVKK